VINHKCINIHKTLYIYISPLSLSPTFSKKRLTFFQICGILLVKYKTVHVQAIILPRVYCSLFREEIPIIDIKISNNVAELYSPEEAIDVCDVLRPDEEESR
jgi:hypothetical protein